MKAKCCVLIRLLLILGFLLGMTGALKNSVPAAAPCTWLGANNTWGDISNWDCMHVPTKDDDVVIPNLANDPIINYPDLYVIYANNLTIQSDAELVVPERLEIIASNIDNYGTIKTTGTMDTPYVRCYATVNNYGLIDAHVGTIALRQGGSHTGTFQGQYGEITIAGDNFYPHTLSATSKIYVKKISFIQNLPINIQGTFRQLWPDSRVNLDYSHVTLSNLVNLSVGAVSIVVDGSLKYGLSGTTVGDISVQGGTSLVGTGSIEGNVTNAGTVSPGASPGKIDVSGDYTQETTGILNIELGGTTAGTEYDQLAVTETAALDGTLQVNLIEGFTPTLDDCFTILTYGSHTGSFSTLNLPTLGSGLDWQVDYGVSSVTLTVTSTGGTIEGTVTYTGSKGYNPVTVALFTNPGDPPVKTIDVPSTTGAYPYTLLELADGTYFVGALMDLDGNDQPNSGEPFAWYDLDGNGQPDPIVISGATPTFTGIDFDLHDPGSIQGMVTYTGKLGITGPISVSAHFAVGADPEATAADIQSGETYNIEGLQPGSYYISAYLDTDNSGGPPNEDELLAWYDEDDDGVPDPVVISTGTTLQTGIDIVLEDEFLQLFLPIILR